MSQGDVILAALLRGERLTKLDCFKMGAGLSINSRIADLRKLGWVIPCEVEIRNGRRMWVYSLVRPTLGIDADGSGTVFAGARP